MMTRTLLLGSTMLVGLMLAVPVLPASVLAQSSATSAGSPTYGPNPTSTKASNITSADTSSPIAPALPSTGLGRDATIAQYLGVARSALRDGKTGLAQEALENAETKSLTRSVVHNAGDTPDGSVLTHDISAALHALGNNDLAMAGHYTDVALQAAGRG